MNIVPPAPVKLRFPPYLWPFQAHLPISTGAWDTSVVGVAAVPPEGRLSCKKVALFVSSKR